MNHIVIYHCIIEVFTEQLEPVKVMLIRQDGHRYSKINHLRQGYNVVLEHQEAAITIRSPQLSLVRISLVLIER